MNIIEFVESRVKQEELETAEFNHFFLCLKGFEEAVKRIEHLTPFIYNFLGKNKVFTEHENFCIIREIQLRFIVAHKEIENLGGFKND